MYIGHFSSYLTPLVIKLTEVTRRECKIKPMTKRKFNFLSDQKEVQVFFMAKREFPLNYVMGAPDVRGEFVS
jgi:hypothetical protein